MALLIDTDVLIHAERGSATEQELGGEDRAISVVTVSELLHGVLRAQKGTRMRRRAFVEHLLRALPSVPITDQVARVHADLWAELAGSGQVIGAHDLWIAATAVAHGFGVATGNRRDFERVPGLWVVGVRTG